MFPARAPEWAAQVIFAQGEAHFFDSPLSLFMYLHDVARYSPGRSVQDIAAAYVHDSARRDDAAWIDARSAFYVHGSNAKGPMRAGNLPAFATQEAAQAFAQRRGGQVLAFRQVDAALDRHPGRAGRASARALSSLPKK
ncbi:MAG: nitrous oxide reductase accessory protein NosL [Paenacidovorax caeni]